MPKKRGDRRRRKKEAQKADQAKATPDTIADKGRAAFLRKDYDTAVKMFSQAIEEDTKNEKLYSNRSASHIFLSNFDEALQDAENCVKLKPEWHKGHYRKGVALEKLLRYQEARAAFKEGEKLAPEDGSIKKCLEDVEALLKELAISLEETAADNPDNDRFTAMVKWMKDGGCKFPKLYLKYYSQDYRGVHTLCKIPPNECVLYVPLKYLMTNEVAMESEIGRAIQKSGYEMRSEHSWLAVYLIQEKHNPNSFWKPYIDILPDKYGNMPMLFGDVYKQFLAGSYSLTMADNRMKSLRAEYDGIFQSCRAFQKYKFMEFVWGRLAVITRIFGLNIHSKKTSALVPYADMLNHITEKQTDWQYDDKRKGYTMITNRHVARGEQIFDSYGRKCNGRYFVNYGFTIDNNFIDNDAVFRATLPRDDPHFMMKFKYLHSSATREFQVPPTYSEDVSVLSENMKPRNMFSFFRFLHARDKELMLLSSADGYQIKDIGPISIRNETAVLKHVQEVARQTLKKFPDDLATDHKMLKVNKFMDMNHRNCIMMRCGEKETLHWYIDLADKAIPLLKMAWKDLKKIAAKCHQQQTRFNYYVTEVVVPLVKNQK
mmetsp:Transcript_3916/g.7502  ORF Transcript_3916/g.7502 Transcript_3916/m.7502 type:complete len:601 (+) Transcript_3916:115-1917(+)|eukprot:CAMPEP_0167790724 /NCGR_PEP_ID=MMETSP0111_2-20121227/11506_1 /TAXON_ID=91324 /ORGANISM="Lotharella globosa, Strain CCCM811" /LENGTH=600 /DNA_ID=CAMNT_0007683247 /DNA_START=43 /DNA_END=1845 /DNA_ORIENTATION=+